MERPIRVTKIEVLDSTSTPGSKVRPIGPSGSIAVFVARKDTRALSDVRAAVAKGGESLEKVVEELRGKHPQKEINSVEEFVQRMISEPVFADIRYGGDVLNRGVFLPQGVELVVQFFPYNGGRLASEGFSLAEYYKEGSDAALEALAVRVPPHLTVAEKAALRLVPKDQLVHNVGVTPLCGHRTWWALAVGVAIAVAGLIIVVSPVEEAHIDEADLKDLGPTASARKLLALRRDLLLEGLGRLRKAPKK
jgi:hypothetical protein